MVCVCSLCIWYVYMVCYVWVMCVWCVWYEYVVYISVCVCVCVCVCECGVPALSWLTLCYPTDCSLPGSSVHILFQARTLDWVAIFYSRGSCQPRDRTNISFVSCIGRQVLYHCATWEAPSLNAVTPENF